MKDREKHSVTPFEKWIMTNYTKHVTFEGIDYYLLNTNPEGYAYFKEGLKNKYIEYLESKNKEYYKFSRN